MEKEQMHFWCAVAAGTILTIVFGVLFINIFQGIPLLGPFVGGLVAGLIAGKDLLNGGKAGLFAGLISAVVISADFLANTKFLQSAIPQFAPTSSVLFLILALLYFAILGFIGGAIGGAVRK